MEITARPPTVFVRGEGSFLWDDTGKRYLDFIQGWAVNCLGHSPPAIAEAISAQAQRLITPSPAYYNDRAEAREGAGRQELFRPGILRQFRRGSQ